MPHMQMDRCMEQVDDSWDGRHIDRIFMMQGGEHLVTYCSINVTHLCASYMLCVIHRAFTVQLGPYNDHIRHLTGFGRNLVGF